MQLGELFFDVIPCLPAGATTKEQREKFAEDEESDSGIQLAEDEKGG